MHHLPRFFGHNNKQATKEMDQKMRRKPKLERRNAAKFFEYDAASSSSSLENSSHSLYTRSMDIYDRTSFRIEGIDGELDLICRSLGLSGPEDFAIPAQAWEDMKKVRSSSDVLPRLKNELGIQDKEELIEELKIEESNQLVGEDRVSIRDVSELGKDEVAESSGSVGIKGFRPPMIKPPPGIRLQVVDDTCSTWDILRDFAPQGESESLENISDDEKELERREEEGGGERGKVEEEEEEGVSEVDNVSRLAVAGSVGEFSGSCSFSTSIEDDTSSSSTGPRSTNISPNVRFRRVISNWQKGELLGRGSFGSVYEGISG